MKSSNFKDLVVYQKSCEVTQEIFDLTNEFPEEEQYSLVEPLRKSSRLMGAKIAEAWAKRRLEAVFILGLTDADGEVQRTRHWIEVSKECGYLAKDHAKKLDAELSEISRILQVMLKRAFLFSEEGDDSIREPRTIYGKAQYFFVDFDREMPFENRYGTYVLH